MFPLTNLLLVGNFPLELGMEVVQEYMKHVVIEFSKSVIVYACFQNTWPTVLSILIELVNHNKIKCRSQQVCEIPQLDLLSTSRLAELAVRRCPTYFKVNQRSQEFVIQEAASSTWNLGMSESGLSKIPYLDGKAKSFGVCVSKFEAYVEFAGMGEVLDSILMKNCPTQWEFAVLDITKPNNQQLVELYWRDKKWWLSQSISMRVCGKVQEGQQALGCKYHERDGCQTQLITA